MEECRYFLILVTDLEYGDTQKLTTLLEEVSRLLYAYSAAILTSSTSDFSYCTDTVTPLGVA